MGLKKEKSENMKTIDTERLILRGWLLDDLNDLYEYPLGTGRNGIRELHGKERGNIGA